MSKKLISLLLSLLLVLGAVGVPVGATGDTTTEPENVTIHFLDDNTNFSKDYTGTVNKMYLNAFNAVGKPSRTGYIFDGWYNATDSTKKIINESDSIVKPSSGNEILLYAKWTAKKVSVTYDYGYDRGSGNGNTETHDETFDSTYSKLPANNPTRSDGYSFVGWFDDRGNPITKSSLVKKETPHTIYARWTLQKITVSLYYDTTTNTNPSQPTETPLVAYGSTVGSIKKPSRTGYNCVWASAASGGTEVVDSTPITSAISLYAKWVPKRSTVTLHPNGGSIKDGGTAPSGEVTYDGDYSGILTTANTGKVERTGYTLVGWTLSSSGTSIVDVTSSNKTKVTATSDHYLYAKWEPNKYTLTYNYAFPTPAVWKDAQGNPIPTPDPPTSPDKATYNSPYPTLPPTPAPSDIPYYSADSKTQYTFEGWYAGAVDTINSTDPTKSDICKEIKDGTNGDIYTLTKDQTLYARWGYEIEFFANTGAAGEKSIGTLKCVTGKAYDVEKKPKEPERAGYTFGGWYDKPNPAETDKAVTLDAFTPADAMNKKLYAHWKNVSYQVTLDPNGGTLEESRKKVSVTYDGKYPDIKTDNVPTRVGYTFKGWFTDKAGGTEVTKDTAVKITNNDTVLYAQWTALPVSISIDYNFPEGFDETKYKKQNLTGDKMPLDEKFNVIGLPLKPDSFTHDKTTFNFAGWYTTKEDTEAKKGKQVTREAVLTENMVENSLNLTLYARWNFDVELYDTPDTKTPNDKSFTTGSLYGTGLYIPVRVGYTFMGWYEEPVKDNAAPETKRISENDAASSGLLKLYAAWSTSAYAIYPDANGGKFSDNQTIPWAFNHGDNYGRYVTDDAYIPTPPAGHTFDGWYTEKVGGRKLAAGDRVTEGGTIYAHWKADQFKVTLKLNYSGAADTVKTVDYGTALKKVLPAPEPERTGYAFLGWFKDESFATPADPEEKIAANMTLYAQWKEGKRVDLVVGGGKLPENTPAYIYVYDGGNFGKLPAPVWPGCVFGGWWTAATGGSRVQPSDTADSNPPAALYARWTPKQVKVNFDFNGAPNLQREPKSYSIGSPYTGLPTYASWPGHEFMGWYTRSVGGEKIEASTLVSVPSDEVEELTIYAHWGYKVSFDPGEGSGDMDQQTAEMNQPYTLPTCTFTPPEGMRFGGWAIGTPDGPKQAGGSQYTVNRHLTLYATWTTAPIVITSSCTSGGSLMTEDGKANEVTVERGTDVTFVAAANTGYVLKELLVDGVNFNYTDVYTFRNVIEDHTIHAVFVPEGAPAYSTCGHGSSCPLAKYKDMAPGAWYHDGVHFCIDNVIMGGTGNGVFSPNSRATRAEVATTLWNYAGRPPIAGSGALPRTYKDVAPSAWYYQAVEWATKEGLLSGYGNGAFRPNNYITREELVSILWHHAGQPKARQTGLRFYDAWQVSNWAWDAMLWATEEGVLSGRSFGYLVPKGTATRAEVATMLKNYLG